MLWKWLFGFIFGCLISTIEGVDEELAFSANLFSALLFFAAFIFKLLSEHEYKHYLIGALLVISGIFWAAGHHAPSPPANSSFHSVASTLRGFVLSKTSSLPYKTKQWSRSILLGHRTYLSGEIKNAFRSTGVYHLLVVSGLHVSLMAATLIFSLKFPLRIIYGLRLIGPTSWRHITPALNILSAMFALIYAGAVGLSQASQRAALIFATFQLSLVFFGSISLQRKIAIAGFLQCLFFAQGFLCGATLMSWGAYLFVVQLAKIHPRRISALFYTQVKLTLLVAATFGQLHTVGVIANLVLIPLFPFVFVSALTLVLLPTDPSPLIAIQTGFIELVDHFAIFPRRYPILSFDLTRHGICIRGVFIFVSSVLLLNTIKSLSSNKVKGG